MMYFVSYQRFNKISAKKYFFLELGAEKIKFMQTQQIRQICMQDFLDSLKRVRHSVSEISLSAYGKWNREFGDVSI